MESVPSSPKKSLIVVPALSVLPVPSALQNLPIVSIPSNLSVPSALPVPSTFSALPVGVKRIEVQQTLPPHLNQSNSIPEPPDFEFENFDSDSEEDRELTPVRDLASDPPNGDYPSGVNVAELDQTLHEEQKFAKRIQSAAAAKSPAKIAKKFQAPNPAAKKRGRKPKKKIPGADSKKIFKSNEKEKNLRTKSRIPRETETEGSAADRSNGFSALSEMEGDEEEPSQSLKPLNSLKSLKSLKSVESVESMESMESTESLESTESVDAMEKFFCNICERTFRLEAQLVRHQRIHSDCRPYPCVECGKCFPWPEHLKAHMKLHLREKKAWQCVDCGQNFSASSALKKHQRQHKNEFRYRCDECGESFYTSEPYKIHVRRHQDHRPFKCGQCEKAFFSRAACRRHLLTHVDYRPFPCSECGKNFRDRQTLDRHCLMHSGEKPWRCSLCQNGLATKFNVRQHLIKVHRISDRKQQDPLILLDNSVVND